MKKFIWLLLMLMSLLQACGKTGSLYLPKPDAAQANSPATNSSASPTKQPAP